MSLFSTPAPAKIAFAKMHGAGNDYVYIPLLTSEQQSLLPENLSELARRISDRHFGVGGDGMVLILPSSVADFAMRIFNADGSEAQMCGNATRCIGKYLYDNHFTDKTSLSLETKGGIKYLTLHPDDTGLIKSVTVDMGSPRLNAEEIPVNATTGKPVIRKPLKIKERRFEITAVNMGNPHGVIVSDDLDDDTVLGFGPILETHEMWPENANIEFIKIIDRDNISMRVWERGSGETLACGTGSCAAVVAGIILGLLNNKVNVHLLGGVLTIEYNTATDKVLMTGPAETVATGFYYL